MPSANASCGNEPRNSACSSSQGLVPGGGCPEAPTSVSGNEHGTSPVANGTVRVSPTRAFHSRGDYRQSYFAGSQTGFRRRDFSRCLAAYLTVNGE